METTDLLRLWHEAENLTLPLPIGLTPPVACLLGALHGTTRFTATPVIVVQGHRNAVLRRAELLDRPLHVMSLAECPALGQFCFTTVCAPRPDAMRDLDLGV